MHSSCDTEKTEIYIIKQCSMTALFCNSKITGFDQIKSAGLLHVVSGKRIFYMKKIYGWRQMYKKYCLKNIFFLRFIKNMIYYYCL